MFRLIGRMLFWTVEKLAAELALVAALLALAAQGAYHQRLIGATLAIVHTVQAFSLAFWRNTPISTVMVQLKGAIAASLDGMTKSVTEDPQTALVAAAVTYICYKLAAKLLRFLRHHLHARLSSREKPPRPSRKEEKKGKTYEQLYDEKDLPATVHRPHKAH